MQGQLSLSLVLCCGIATLQGVSNDSGDEAIQVVAQDLDGGQVHIQQLFVLTGGIHLLVEVQDLLLQGVQAVQMDLAFLLPKLLLLCLLHMVVLAVVLLVVVVVLLLLLLLLSLSKL